MEQSIGEKVLHGTIVIMIVGVLAKVASFISEMILAAYLGTTGQGDAYYMISGVQTVIYPMISVGIWMVFLPIYKEKRALEYNDEADSLANKAISFFSTISVVVVVLLVFFADIAVSVVAPGFGGEIKSLCIRLVRISAPMYLFIVVAAIYASILQANGKFLGSQIREVASHIPTILAAIFFYERYGISCLAVALVLGGAIRILIELPFVDWGYRFKPDFRFHTKDFGLMLRRLPSALISEGVVQINTLVDKIMASILPEGSVSGLNYGQKLLNVFSGLISGAVATALYPQIIELIARKQKEALSKLLTKTINIFSVLMLPITLACIMFRTELTAAVFQRGYFDVASTKLTANLFAIYCIGLFFMATSSILIKVFYGYGKTKAQMYVSIVNLVSNVVFNLIFIRYWGANGLAAATTLTTIITFFLRLYIVCKCVAVKGHELVTVFLKVLVASFIATIIPRALFWYIPSNQYVTLIISAVMGIGLYLLLVKLLRVKEISDVISILCHRLNKQKKQ